MVAWADHARRRLAELDTSDELLEELDRERQRLAGEVTDLAAVLTGARREAATRFSADVTAELAGLAMPHARIEVVVAPKPVGARTAPTTSSCGCCRTRARRRSRCRKARPAASCPG